MPFIPLRPLHMVFTAAALLLVPALSVLSDAAQEHQPYAGMEGRDIKALSPERIEGLMTGKGIGYALAAELNHYPGPRHALDMNRELNLSAEQNERVKTLFDGMEARAVALGKQIIAVEKKLDHAFSSRTATAETVEGLTGEIGRLEGALRAVHLTTHLEMAQILTPHQIKLYDQLRGYADGGAMVHTPGMTH